MKACSRCEVPTDMICEGCGLVRYCSIKCKTTHWNDGTHDARACEVAGNVKEIENDPFEKLSNDAVTVILNNLDIKQIMRFRTMSRRMRNIIDSATFFQPYIRIHQNKIYKILKVLPKSLLDKWIEYALYLIYTTNPQEALYMSIRLDYGKGVSRFLLDDRVDPATDNNWAIRLAASVGHAGVVELLLSD